MASDRTNYCSVLHDVIAPLSILLGCDVARRFAEGRGGLLRSGMPFRVPECTRVWYTHHRASGFRFKHAGLGC